MFQYIPPDEITQARLGVATLYVIALREADASNLQRDDLFFQEWTDVGGCFSVWLTADSAEMYVAKYLRGKEPTRSQAFRDTDPKVLALSLEQLKNYLALLGPFRLGLLTMDDF